MFNVISSLVSVSGTTALKVKTAINTKGRGGELICASKLVFDLHFIDD